MLLSILVENLGEASGLEPTGQKLEAEVQLQAAKGSIAGHRFSYLHVDMSLAEASSLNNVFDWLGNIHMPVFLSNIRLDAGNRLQHASCQNQPKCRSLHLALASLQHFVEVMCGHGLR